jgi:excisionase family DNA binding protein
MPEMTLTEAAKWAGVTRPTIHKALKSGRLSGRKDEAGEWRIEPSELERVYALRKPGDTAGNAELSTPDIADALAAREREIALLREMLAEVRAQRDDAMGQRDKMMALAEAQTRLLTHQQEQRATPTPALRARLRLGQWLRRSGDG